MDSCLVVQQVKRGNYIGGGEYRTIEEFPHESPSSLAFSDAVDRAMSMFMEIFEYTKQDIDSVHNQTKNVAYIDEELAFADFTGTKT